MPAHASPMPAYASHMPDSCLPMPALQQPVPSIANLHHWYHPIMSTQASASPHILAKPCCSVPAYASLCPKLLICQSMPTCIAGFHVCQTPSMGTNQIQPGQDLPPCANRCQHTGVIWCPSELTGASSMPAKPRVAFYYTQSLASLSSLWASVLVPTARVPESLGTQASLPPL